MPAHCTLNIRGGESFASDSFVLKYSRDVTRVHKLPFPRKSLLSNRVATLEQSRTTAAG